MVAYTIAQQRMFASKLPLRDEEAMLKKAQPVIEMLAEFERDTRFVYHGAPVKLTVAAYMSIEILAIVAGNACTAWNPLNFQVDVGFFRPAPPNNIVFDSDIFPGYPDEEGLTPTMRQIRKQLFAWVPSRFYQMHVYHHGFPVRVRFLYRSRHVYPRHGLARYELGWRVYDL